MTFHLHHTGHCVPSDVLVAAVCAVAAFDVPRKSFVVHCSSGSCGPARRGKVAEAVASQLRRPDGVDLTWEGSQLDPYLMSKWMPTKWNRFFCLDVLPRS